MKAESLTKKQLGELLVGLAIDKLEFWAKKEIDFLTYNYKKVVCLPLTKNSWLVGKYKVVKKDQEYVIYDDNKPKYKFQNNRAVFVYCVLDKLRIHGLSNQILLNDQLINRLANELNTLEFKRKIYNKRNNDKFFIIDSRLSEVKLKLDQAKKDLEKNLLSAKYLKVWD